MGDVDQIRFIIQISIPELSNMNPKVFKKT